MRARRMDADTTKALSPILTLVFRLSATWAAPKGRR
jgi:hypothetical protein